MWKIIGIVVIPSIAIVTMWLLFRAIIYGTPPGDADSAALHAALRSDMERVERIILWPFRWRKRK